MKIKRHTLNIPKKFTKILVVSDTHKHFDGVVSLLDQGSYDFVLHLGDLTSDAEDLQAIFPHIPVFYVKGNCDFYDSATPDMIFLTVNGCRMLLCHGHQYDVKYTPDRIGYLGLENQVDIVFHGHTHQRNLKKISKEGAEVTIFNPGSITQPRDGKAPSFGLLELTSRGEFHLSFGEK